MKLLLLLSILFLTSCKIDELFSNKPPPDEAILVKGPCKIVIILTSSDGRVKHFVYYYNRVNGRC